MRTRYKEDSMQIPHCPNPACINFWSPCAGKWYQHYGFYHTKVFGKVARLRCSTCGKTFSTQTFHINYYAKKVIEYEPIIEHLVTASGNLDLYRKLGVSAASVENRIERLSRVVLAIHASLLRVLPLREDFAADGLESFSYSQYYPAHVNVFAGSSSEFIYELGLAVLRRKGRMTKEQRERRDRLDSRAKADPKGIEKSMRHLAQDLTDRLVMKGVIRKVLYTDEHPAYPRAFRRIPDFPLHLLHVRIPSTAPRTWLNPLFPVNYVDRQIRKDSSDHARQTVQFARCPSALMARMAVYRFYHNCCIPRRVQASRQKNYETHAERAGVSTEVLHQIIKRHWMHRCFLLKQNLGVEERTTWLCGWRNPGIPLGRYIPKYVCV
jgi:hypothetical protein